MPHVTLYLTVEIGLVIEKAFIPRK